MMESPRGLMKTKRGRGFELETVKGPDPYRGAIASSALRRGQPTAVDSGASRGDNMKRPASASRLEFTTRDEVRRSAKAKDDEETGNADKKPERNRQLNKVGSSKHKTREVSRYREDDSSNQHEHNSAESTRGRAKEKSNPGPAKGPSTAKPSRSNSKPGTMDHVSRKALSSPSREPIDFQAHSSASFLDFEMNNKPNGPVFHTANNHGKSSGDDWTWCFRHFHRSLIEKASGSPVRITVIDTGIHASHPYIEKKWTGFSADGKSLFCDFTRPVPSASHKGKGSENHKYNTNPIDEDGHGTFIAGLLLRLVQNIELSVARIGLTQSSICKDRDLDFKMGEAIKYAKEEWKAEVISISMECRETGRNRDPLRDALHHDIIVVASAGNSGNNSNVPFPAKYDRVFKVFASKADGWKDDNNPAVEDPRYSFFALGHGIKSTWPSTLKEKAKEDNLQISDRKGYPIRSEHEGSTEGGLDNTWTVMDGTSFAVPIVAAIVVALYQFYNSYGELFNLVESSEKFKSITSIRLILDKICKPGSGSKYLQPAFLDCPSFLVPNGRQKEVIFADELTKTINENFH